MSNITRSRTRRGDVDVLDSMATKDFILVGQLGFLLDKTQRLDRYRGGDFVTSALDWRDTQVRVFGDCAIVVGIHDQEASYRGQANDGQFRATTSLCAKATRGGWPAST
jgi:ketosteroid isomerase-like protein